MLGEIVVEFFGAGDGTFGEKLVDAIGLNTQGKLRFEHSIYLLGESAPSLTNLWAIAARRRKAFVTAVAVNFLAAMETTRASAELSVIA